MGRPFENQVEITELEPAKRFGFSAQTKNFGTFRHRFVLTPIPTGVRVDRVIDAPKIGGLAALQGAFFDPRARERPRNS